MRGEVQQVGTTNPQVGCGHGVTHDLTDLRILFRPTFPAHYDDVVWHGLVFLVGLGRGTPVLPNPKKCFLRSQYITEPSLESNIETLVY